MKTFFIKIFLILLIYQTKISLKTEGVGKFEKCFNDTKEALYIALVLKKQQVMQNMKT